MTIFKGFPEARKLETLEIQGGNMLEWENDNRKPSVVILIANKRKLKVKSIKCNKERYFIQIKNSIN